ncbi:MAG: hypothetical protein COA78_04765 [Blastopirellula sp.]|nr:MAG: hypothetical protein COA78_04765 [Blastopirellula sp.]
MRYDQSVEFMRVPSITGQYTYDIGLGGSFGNGPAPNSKFFDMGMQSKPTIVYTPEQGQEFNQRLLSPIQNETLELLSSKGWRIDRLLMLVVHNINDVENATSAGGPTPTYKPVFEEFLYFTKRMRALQVADHSLEVTHKTMIDAPIQVSDPIPLKLINGEAQLLAAEKGYRFRVSEDGTMATLWKNEQKSQEKVLRFANYAANDFDVNEICTILELDPSLKEFWLKSDIEGQLLVPNNRRDPSNEELNQRDELIISMRSLKEVMYFLSQPIEVPRSHIEKGFVRETIDPATGCPFDWQEIFHELFQVHSGKLPPLHAAVSIQYRGHWFYIDDADIDSKRTFNLLLELFNLKIRAGGGAQIPLLTI